MDVIKIIDWDKHYENNRTRELKRMAWVPMPNRHDGDGYTSLMDHPNGSAHFGAWCALVEVASRCDIRGTLLRGGAEGLKNGLKPHDAASLSRMTRIPVKVWEEVLPRLVTIGWIRLYEIPQEDAASPQEDAPESHLTANERKKERKKGKTRVRAPALPREDPPSSPPAQTKTKNPQPTRKPQFPEKDRAMIIELMEIHKKATGVSLTISDEEMTDLLRIFRQHDGEKVVAAYRICQKEKPGKPFRFFLDDFAMYFAKLQPSESLEPTCPECGVPMKLANRYGHKQGCSKAKAPPAEDVAFPEASA